MYQPSKNGGPIVDLSLLLHNFIRCLHILRLVVNDPGLWLAKVNPNGETYPVGLFVSSYAASYAAQYLGSILIQALKRHAWILG